MNIHRIKFIAVIIFATGFAALSVMSAAPIKVAAISGSDPAAEYKAKCAACHMPNASKFFDPAQTDEICVETIMKGRKGAKPPFMPAFEAKGMTVDAAKALAAYMKGLRTAAN